MFDFRPHISSILSHLAMATPPQRRQFLVRREYGNAATDKSGRRKRALSGRPEIGVAVSRHLLMRALLLLLCVRVGARVRWLPLSCREDSRLVVAVPTVAALEKDPSTRSPIFSKILFALRGGGGGTSGESYSSRGTTEPSLIAPTWGSRRLGVLGLDRTSGDDRVDDPFGLTPGANRNWVDEDDYMDQVGFDEKDDPISWADRRSRQGFYLNGEEGEGRRETVRKRVRRISLGAFLPASTTTRDAALGSSNGKLVPPSSRFMTTGTTIAGIVVEVDDDDAQEESDNGNRTLMIDRSGGSNTDQLQAANKARKTRTIVILGADTRATAGRIVADKNASKIHPLASNLFACGAGTSADLMHVTRQAEFTFRLTRSYSRDVGNDNITLVSSPTSNTEEATDDDTNAAMSVNVHAACRWLQSALYEQGGSCQANLIVGGVQVPDRNSGTARRRGGARKSVAVLRAIHPHGSSDDVKFAALGSGGLAAMAVLESRYRPHYPTLQDAIRLVTDAIRAGISNDLGSGSSIDLCILDSSTGRATHIRSAIPEEVLPSQTVARKDDASSADGPRRHAELGSMPGVNGFGNVPFTVRSSRIIQRYHHDDEDDGADSAWNEILGLR
jgi:20S proteasome alpha/beta subunit